ncbi:MAG: YicC/YloC family endoribonuclease [Chlamydiales bacterium]
MSNAFQLNSMTAYGRGTYSSDYGRLSLEIQSTNHRYLEFQMNLPRFFTFYEIPLRKKITNYLGRGMVRVLVNWQADPQIPTQVIPNLSLLRSLKRAWEEAAYELGLEEKIDLHLLAHEKHFLSFKEKLPPEELLYKGLESSLEEALDMLLEMRKKEGGLLAQDLYKRMQNIETLIETIEEEAPKKVKNYHDKLIKRVEEFLTGQTENEERILREVVLFAERIDISEEIIRFKSHMTQFLEVIKTPLVKRDETRGKTLDFLIQELNREINTIGSKSMNVVVNKRVVEVKSELEKIREQTQNIE